MDFVDLDKVLDQFEEEEKAAGELQPGQETKPSGYAEYLASHQDRPWEALSFAAAEESSLKLHGHQNSHSITYDDPYDSYSLGQHLKIPVSGQGVISGSKQVDEPDGVHANNSINSDYHQSHNGIGYSKAGSSMSPSVNLNDELSQAKLKQNTIESYLPPRQNGSPGIGGQVDVCINGKRDDEGERRGLIASQPASIQTDVLTPNSEQELLSSPFPKSNIIVVGHENSPQYTSTEDESEASECAGMHNGTGITYADVSSIEPKHQVSGEHLPASDTRASVETPASCENIPSDSRSSAGESCVVETQRKEIETDHAAENKSWGEGEHQLNSKPGDVNGKQLEPKEQTVSSVGTDDSVKDKPNENCAVGFDVEECDVDQEEVDAYLQDLDENSDSGCEDVTGQSQLSSDAPARFGISQNKVDHGSSQNMDTADVPGKGSGFSVPAEVSTVVIPEAMETEGVTQSVVTNIPDSVNMPDISESHCDGSQVMDTDNETEHSKMMEDMRETAVADSNNSSMSENSSPDIVADTSRITAASIHSHPRERAQPMDVSDVDVPRVADGPKQEDALSLDFPVSGPGSELSTLVKGRLEIENLLDEAVAARLAEKQAESSKAAPAPPPPEQAPASVHSTERMTVEQSKPEMVSQSFEPHGTVYDGSTGDGSRDPTSGSQNMLGSSPSPTLGIGARPKDPSQMKKNRPNSLLGLSKISLGTPFSPPQTVSACPQAMEGQVLSGQQQPVTDGGRPPYSMHPVDHVNPTDTVMAPQGQQYHMDARLLSAPPPGMNVPTQDMGAPVPGGGAPVPVSAGAVQASDLEVPVMRRPDSGFPGDVGEGVEASCGGQRPRSWSPSTLSSPTPTQKMKRPTSLNLPVRQDFNRVGSVSPDGDGTRTRKAEVMQEMGMANDTGSSEDDSIPAGDADGGSSGGADSLEEGGAAAAAEVQFDNHPQSILHMNLGKVAPTWVPDASAPTCMSCDARFTFTKRRHHCRACGKVFCSNCCSLKSRLAYQDNKEGRVCTSCHQLLAAAESCGPAGVACRSPNPNNPTEYCSTIPPPQQANARAPLPTVMVPTGVLKREGSNRKSEPKQVMFSDGIRPGGDLTELDGSDQARLPPRRTGRVQKKVERSQGEHASPKTRRLRGGEGMRNPCLIPEEGLPPVVVGTDDKGEVTMTETSDPASLMAQIRNEEAKPVMFAVNRNLFILVKIINLDCCVNRKVWCFTTRGMITVGQEELVMVLETMPEEDSIPRDIFCHFSTVYDEAGKGNTVTNMGHSIFNQQFLDSRGHGGLLYLRSSFQCTLKLVLPDPPFLFAILLQKWETPWAKVFPIRLMLRLGAEYRYYPCPLVSIRNRKPVFYEIGHTIMNLLADFRNFQYMLPQIRGVTIHMEDKKTYINLPRNRYEDLMKVVNDSNEHVMAMGASFSLDADSHLVCIQNEDGNYQTQAINIQNKPRQVTGASFVVFNGALKSSSGLRAKSSIVEDGLMVQIMPEMMAALKQSMKDMVDFTIGCGSVTIPQPEEMVMVRWVDDDKQVNMGVKSPVDGMALDGVESIHINNATDYVGEHFAIRWTEVFFLQTESGSSRWEPVDLSRVAETLASAVCIALTPHLDKLKQTGLTKIGLRVTLEPERVGYEVGSSGEKLPDFYMNDLDNALIPVIHGAIAQSREGPIVLELVLHVIY